MKKPSYEVLERAFENAVNSYISRADSWEHEQATAEAKRKGKTVNELEREDFLRIAEGK
jgi:hypothetical protein